MASASPRDEMSDTERKVTARADLIGGVAWMAFGIAIAAGALAMDRLEQFGATTYTAPGLVPGLLGVVIVLLGLLLAWRALRHGAIAELSMSWARSPEGIASARRAGIATALALVYTLGLIGRIPFPIATALFVFAFIMVFDVSVEAPRAFAKRALIAALVAIVTTLVVTLVFERVFLVRLP